METNFNHKEIASRVREIMTDVASRSVRDFANDVGIDCSNMLKKLKLTSPFTKRDIALICQSLDVNYSWLAFGDGNKYKAFPTRKPTDVSEVDMLKMENVSLKQRLQCVENERDFLRSCINK